MRRSLGWMVPRSMRAQLTSLDATSTRKSGLRCSGSPACWYVSIEMHAHRPRRGSSESRSIEAITSACVQCAMVSMAVRLRREKTTMPACSNMLRAICDTPFSAITTWGRCAVMRATRMRRNSYSCAIIESSDMSCFALRWYSIGNVIIMMRAWCMGRNDAIRRVATFFVQTYPSRNSQSDTRPPGKHLILTHWRISVRYMLRVRTRIRSITASASSLMVSFHSATWPTCSATRS